MAIEDQIERIDPNAPKVFDRSKCQRLLRIAPSFTRLPNSGIVTELAEQLQCAVDQLDHSSTQVAEARTEGTRYRKESETANTEVRTMQAMLITARDERDAFKREVELLKAPPPPPKVEVPAPKKRGRPAKVVPIQGKVAS